LLLRKPWRSWTRFDLLTAASPHLSNTKKDGIRDRKTTRQIQRRKNNRLRTCRDSKTRPHNRKPPRSRRRPQSRRASCPRTSPFPKKLLRKLDFKLIPWLSFLYLISFLDRTNIGNAKVDGLQEDLGMTDGQYNASLTIFFVSYSVFEPLTNVLLKKLRPSIFLPLIMIWWGVCMTCMGLVHNYAGLMTAVSKRDWRMLRTILTVCSVSGLVVLRLGCSLVSTTI
jgi:hypothetical protein